MSERVQGEAGGPVPFVRRRYRGFAARSGAIGRLITMMLVLRPVATAPFRNVGDRAFTSTTIGFCLATSSP